MPAWLYKPGRKTRLCSPWRRAGMRRIRIPIGGLLLAVLSWWVCGLEGGPAATASLRFEVSVAKGLLSTPHDGRVLIVLGRKAKPEPRLLIGETGMTAPP